MPKVSKQYKEKKRQLILDSALKFFGEKGYHSASMDDIVGHAKVSKGLIYNYFKNKEDLYLALLHNRTEHSIRIFKENLEQVDSPTLKIKKLFELHRNRELTEEAVKGINVIMEFFVNSSRHEHLRQIQIDRFKVHYQTLVAEVVQAGIEAGEFKSEIDPNTAASLLYGIFDGITLKYCIFRDETFFKETFESAEKMFIKYLSKE